MFKTENVAIFVLVATLFCGSLVLTVNASEASLEQTEKSPNVEFTQPKREVRKKAVTRPMMIIDEELRRQESEKLNFEGQKVIFNPDDYMEPVVYEDCYVTAYCNCESCCGVYAGKRTTATGAEVVEGVTIAVDPSVIPYGSIVELDGHFYIAQDCGGAVDGLDIDVYIEDTGAPHTRCYEFIRNLGQMEGNVIRVWEPMK